MTPSPFDREPGYVRVECRVCHGHTKLDASRVREGRAPCQVCGDIRPVLLVDVPSQPRRADRDSA